MNCLIVASQSLGCCRQCSFPVSIITLTGVAANICHAFPSLSPTSDWVFSRLPYA